MLARDVMTTTVATVSPDTLVFEIAALLLDRHISAVPVVNADGHVLGIVSEGDLIHHAGVGTKRKRSFWLSLLTGSAERAREYLKTHGPRAEDVMTRGVVTIGEDLALGKIAELLERRRIKRVPVVRDGKLVGIVSRGDLLRGLVASRATAQASVTPDDRKIREQLLREMDALGLAPRPAICVSDGVVHLWGICGDPEQARALRVAAETIPGVRAVEDYLSVEGQPSLASWRRWPVEDHQPSEGSSETVDNALFGAVVLSVALTLGPKYNNFISSNSVIEQVSRDEHSAIAFKLQELNDMYDIVYNIGDAAEAISSSEEKKQKYIEQMNAIQEIYGHPKALIIKEDNRYKNASETGSSANYEIDNSFSTKQLQYLLNPAVVVEWRDATGEAINAPLPST